ncbi:hypothetical protein GCM10007207_19370 [Asaia siamensis]|uniref:ParB/Sulfiredoxin domain-containing protein n=2 Tax=Asaia siamensis TaxID=110479 RepID=A0ABQ1M342_9PROT|nr:hypothetical protein AA0323_1415 [Asaia siamensis NRIC 0323]GGC33960.1 hypothetical protein GCM10007207_19370 [Asaia siamensis]
MYSDFEYKSIDLKNILLDYQNPRLVTQSPLKTQDEIVSYMFEHEGLSDFIRKIAQDGKNKGAERPYIIKSGKHYTVIEGNTRIAAYKLLTGILKPPVHFSTSVPHISPDMKENLLSVDCSIAPDRDTLFPIMASAHFGLGDKSKWGYLGSRKAVFDEWKSGKTIEQLSKIFGQSKSSLGDYIIEYNLYQKSLDFSWTKRERVKLTDPAIKFNPPVRFLQTQGHKEKVGISFDKDNFDIQFKDELAKEKYKHLIKKLVINNGNGLKATSTYEEVFADFVESVSSSPDKEDPKDNGNNKEGSSSKDNPSPPSSNDDEQAPSSPDPSSPKPKAGTLFAYPVTKTNSLLKQLLKEAKTLNVKTYPASGTFLLRNIIESLLKEIIHTQNANPDGKPLDLEGSINLCLNNIVKLPQDDKKILKEFKNHHLQYLNLGAHGNVIPNPDRLFSARDCIDVFVRKHI